MDLQRLLEDLTEEQRKPVLEGDGPVLVIAGAGTGKTRVLTYRIAYLLARGVPQHRILALTFTNKAADEMRERMAQLLGWRPEHLFLGTFHSFAAQVLRREASLLGYGPNFTIYDRDDQKQVVKKLLTEAEREERSVNGWVHLISLWKTDRRPPEPAEQRLLERYQEALRRANAMDFDDLLLNLRRLLADFPEVRHHYAERYQYILVDEYQDTNRIQFDILTLLSEVHHNLFVVGDEDQAIYGFRGADIRNVLDFQRTFPGARVFRLQQNFRSTGLILKAASAVVARNSQRLGKTLWTDRGQGKPIVVYHFGDEMAEAHGLAELILDSDRPFSDYVILFRTNFQSRPFEEVFTRQRIPHQVVGTLRFYERKEIKDVLAYLKLAINPRDREAFYRAVNTPPRGIGPQTLQRLEQVVAETGLTLPEAAEHLAEDLRGRSRQGLQHFLQILARIQAHRDNALEALRAVLRETAYLDYLRRSFPDAQGESRVDNVTVLLNSLEGRTEEAGPVSLMDYLTEVNLRTDVDDWQGEENAVTLMTVHTAKGLEFPVVIISGLEEGIFPHRSAFYDPDELEEERRLFHVALTRAQEEVVLTHVDQRSLRRTEFLRPSRFLQEIPPETLARDEAPAPPKETGDAFHLEQAFRPGDRVRHSWFGVGRVLRVYDGKAEVLFASGKKTLSLKYARLQKLD